MKKNRVRLFPFLTGLALLVLPVSQVFSQELDVPYVPTPEEVVEKMLDITNVGPGDYVIDLGSGDGRIVIAAAKKGAVGHGVDLNPQRVEEANKNARDAGVFDRVVFFEGDLFEADISKASVITMYLLSSVNLKLRPVLLKELRPGTRIVSHSFSMGEWEADEHVQVNNRHVYYWVIPANLRGSWEWETNGERFTMRAGQEFQKVNINLTSGKRSFEIQEPLLVGERVSFSANDKRNGTDYVFNGRIDGNNISGMTHIISGNSRRVENWSATLQRR